MTASPRMRVDTPGGQSRLPLLAGPSVTFPEGLMALPPTGMQASRAAAIRGVSWGNRG